MSAAPNYLAALLKIVPTLPAGFVVVDVLHDGWCSRWTGGACDCDVEFVVHREGADDDPR